VKTPKLLLLTLFISALVLSACGGGTTAEPTKVPPTKAPEPTPLPTTEISEPTEVPEPSGDSDQVSEVIVEIVDSSFESNTITIPVGTTVVWMHNGRFPHTVTLDDGSFDSGNLGSGETFSFTFTEVGTYSYYCSIHGGPGGQGMSGVIIVTE
jgi:plastocyanin